MSDYKINHYPSTSSWQSRKRKLRKIFLDLKLQNKKILDIGGSEHESFCKEHNIDYTSVNIEEPQNTGTGGYHKNDNTIFYDGRNLPFKNSEFDLVVISMVFHHCPENTFYLLNQIKNISKKYIIVGEDLAELNYEMEWHERNFKHQPGGIFRSDEEWRTIFKLYNLKLTHQYVIHRDYDIDPNKIYRCYYLLEKE
tara:strand:- start:1079 stop:1666 length:588 start_codon:yes stop_codon:yes gene_type:complete